jgi:hypothetical protein
MPSRHAVRIALWVCALSVVLPELRAGEGSTPFTEEAAQRGVVLNVAPVQASIFGYGVAIADLDADGHMDIIAAGDASGTIRIWQNDGSGNFIDRSPEPVFEPHIPSRRYSGISASDADNDGDLDLFLTAWGQPDVFLRNEGDWEWSDQTDSTGLGDLGAGCGMAWADINGDGWLDVYMANRTGTFIQGQGLLQQQNRMYINNGDGTFSDVAAALGIVDPGAPSFQGGFLDYNEDGRPDLYLANDKGSGSCTFPSRLFRNNGDTFEDVSEETNAFLCIDGMTVTIGDFNNDLIQDIYVSNVAVGNALLVGQTDHSFRERAAVTGTLSSSVSWGSHFLDVENDGHLELFVANSGSPNELFSHNGAFPCNDLAPQYGVTGGANDFSFCAAIGDLNNDGAMDLVVSSTSRPLRVYINNEGANRDWLMVRPISEHAYRDAHNAIVTVTSNLGTFRREITPNSGYKSQNDARAHFGLGENAVIEEVRVRWPSGTETVLTDVQPNQTITVTSPCLADIIPNGQVDLADLNALLSRYGQTVDRMSAGDLNANGGVDFDDLTTLLALFATSPCGD